MKAEMRQVLSGNGLCNESFGYLRKKPICNESGQQILNSSRMCCCEMCVPRGEKKIIPLLIEKQQLIQTYSQMSVINSLVCGSILLNFGPSGHL